MANQININRPTTRIVIISVMPMVIEWWRARKHAKQAPVEIRTPAPKVEDRADG